MSTSPRGPLSTITNNDPKSARKFSHQAAIKKIQRDNSEMKQATSGNTADMIEIKNAIAQSIAKEKKIEEEDAKANAAHLIELAKQNELNDEMIGGLKKTNARVDSLAMRMGKMEVRQGNMAEQQGNMAEQHGNLAQRFDTHMDVFAKARKNLNTKISAVKNQTDALEIKQGVDHSKFAAIASIISE